MKKLFLSLLFVFVFVLRVKAEDKIVTQDWQQLAAAGDEVIITAETGDLVLVWSAGAPVTVDKKGLQLKQRDTIIFVPTSGDLWARSSSTQGVRVTVNLSTEAALP